ncbi:hypothetical protein AB0T30_06745, partial [Lactobacillus crispatus]
SVCVFFVQTNHTRKELLFLMFKEINLRNHSSLHKLFYSLRKATFDNYVKAGKVIDNLFPTAKLGKLDDVQMQSILDKYGKTHSKKTVTELLKKIRTALRYAYVKGYIYNDFAFT